MADGRLKIVKPAPPRESRRPIDTFLLSPAEDQRENTVCIILSGTGSDGAKGVSAVKEHGGLTLAQAEYGSQALSGMPQSAADTGHVDEVLPVAEMPACLMSHTLHRLKGAGRKDEKGLYQDTASDLMNILRELHALRA